MAAFIMAGPMQALCFVVLFAFAGLFIPGIGLLSSAALGLITLRLGWKQGTQTALPASLILIAAALLLHDNPAMGLVPRLAQWLLVIGLASMLQTASSWRQVMTAIFTITATGILLFYLFTGDVAAFWQALMQPVTDELLKLQPHVPELNLVQVMENATVMMTGVAAVLFSLSLTLALMIARHWQAMLYNPDGFRQEIRELRLPRTLGLVVMVLTTVSLLTGMPLLVDIAFAGLAVFLFQGIALIHGLHHQREMHRGWLIGFYVLLVLMPFRFGLLLATFGIIDSVADFRRYLAKPRP